MMWRTCIVESVRRKWSEAIELGVRLEDGSEGRALAYAKLVGAPEVGDEVLVTSAAVAKGLGTGGYLMVVAVPGRLPADPPPAPGHIVKARYTPLQYLTMGIDEQESEHHRVLEDADSLEGMPVAVADLHSSLAPAIAGLRALRPEAKVAYIMTDGGALPAWFSMAAARLRDAGWIIGTISCGQAFGGDVEAVTIHTALLAARHVLGADVAIVAQGPGNLGTGTRWGFSGTQAGDAVNAINALGGRAVGLLRMSQCDERSRHFGLSHHSVTALGRVALTPALCPVPEFDASDELSGLVSDEVQATMFAQLEDFFASAPHVTRRDVPTGGLSEAFRFCPVKLSTMGRGLKEDPLAFLAAGIAGYALADMLPSL